MVSGSKWYANIRFSNSKVAVGKDRRVCTGVLTRHWYVGDGRAAAAPRIDRHVWTH